MPPFDTSRFLLALAGSLHAGAWTAVGLRASFKEATAEWSVRIPGLIDRLLVKYPEKPDFGPLLAFLIGDDGMTRAMNRLSGRPTPRRRTGRIRPSVMGQPPPKLGALPIPALPTAVALARWFGITPGRLDWLADPSGRNRLHPKSLRTYRQRWIAKPGGRARLLEIPMPLLKKVQRRLLEGLLAQVPVHPSAHGFRAGYSAITNAAEHCGREIVIRFDLADFFPSIPIGRVFALFATLGYPRAVARLLAGLLTTRLPSDVWKSRPKPALDGSDHAVWQRLHARHLPQGAPTSPAIANLVAFRLDRRLAGLAAELDATYTRYADDLTFSGGLELARSAKRLAHLVAVIAGEEGFTLNHRKTRVQRRGGQQMVTGLVVNARPNLPRGEFDRLKAILTNCVRRGPLGQNRAKHPDFRTTSRARSRTWRP